MLKALPSVLMCFCRGRFLGRQTPGFDVASIHPHDPRESRFVVHMPSNGQFAATGAVAKLVLIVAYDVQESQIVGGQTWLDSEKWDIETKSDRGREVGVGETRRMLQSMLEERCALRIHREMQQRPA